MDTHVATFKLLTTFHKITVSHLSLDTCLFPDRCHRSQESSESRSGLVVVPRGLLLYKWQLPYNKRLVLHVPSEQAALPPDYCRVPPLPSVEVQVPPAPEWSYRAAAPLYQHNAVGVLEEKKIHNEIIKKIQIWANIFRSFQPLTGFSIRAQLIHQSHRY